MFSHHYYALLPHLLFRQNSSLSLSMLKREESSISFLKTWNIPNHPHQFIVVYCYWNCKWYCQETMHIFGLQIRLHENDLKFIGTLDKNLAYYFTKHQPAMHHTQVRPYYLHVNYSPAYLVRATDPSIIQGCIGTDTHGYGNHTPLPKLQVVHSTQDNKQMNPEAYFCARTHNTVPIPWLLLGHQLASPWPKCLSS